MHMVLKRRSIRVLMTFRYNQAWLEASFWRRRRDAAQHILGGPMWPPTIVRTNSAKEAFNFVALLIATCLKYIGISFQRERLWMSGRGPWVCVSCGVVQMLIRRPS